MQLEVASTCSNSHQIFKTSCKGCNHIRNIWLNYACQCGFEDIEQKNLPTLDQSYRLSQQIAFKSHDMFHIKVNYFNWAEQALTTHQFKTTTDKLIWEYHVEGLSRRQIAPRIGLEHSWVSRKIQKIKSYLKDQAQED